MNKKINPLRVLFFNLKQAQNSSLQNEGGGSFELTEGVDVTI
jgi:hypothetical protein